MVRIETRPSKADSRIEDYVVTVGGQIVFRTGSKLEADYIAAYVLTIK